MKPNGGFALAAAMMVLALLSVLAIAATQSTTLETQISAHDRDARAALYVAEAALEEARYYTARGWGKIESHLSNQVHVRTPLSGPVDFWQDNRYAGFALVDAAGAEYEIQEHTDVADPVITLVTGDPARGRFLIYRAIPTPTDLAVTWDGTSRLEVQNAAWAAATAPDRWNGWVLWNAAGEGLLVSDSGVSLGPDTVWLELPADPGAGPYRLALNPWVTALAAGQKPPGDGDTTTAAWDRSFTDAGGNPAGSAAVEATELTDPDGHHSGYHLVSYGLVSTSPLHNAQRAVSLTVGRDGLPEQRIGDWKVEGEL